MTATKKAAPAAEVKKAAPAPEVKKEDAPKPKKAAGSYVAKPVEVEAYEIEEISKPDDNHAVSVKLKGRDEWLFVPAVAKLILKPAIGSFVVLQGGDCHAVLPKDEFEQKYEPAK